MVPNNDAEANPATAHMFIVNPLSGRGADNLFTTHPSTANRIARLQQLAGAVGARQDFVPVDRDNEGPWGPATEIRTGTSRKPPRRPGPWG